jgi:hypothetical protein
MRSRSKSTSSTCTVTSSPTCTTVPGWSTCFHDSSDTWMSPSMPPRSTNAPNDTTLDTTPWRTSPGFRWVRNSSRASFWVSSRKARRDSTTLLRLRSSSMILACRVLPMYGARSRTRRSSTSDAGRKPRRPMSMMRPPLTTSMTGPSTTPSASLSFLDGAPRPLVLGPLLRQDQTAFLVLLGEDQRFDLLTRADDLARVDVVADAQLTSGDDPSDL